MPRAVLDEACTVLRALHQRLPRDLVWKPTETSKNADKFARRYGKPVAIQLQKAEAISDEGVWLQQTVAVQVLTKWLLKMAAYQKGQDNAFQWRGFWISETEARDRCGLALWDADQAQWDSEEA